MRLCGMHCGCKQFHMAGQETSTDDQEQPKRAEQTWIPNTRDEKDREVESERTCANMGSAQQSLALQGHLFRVPLVSKGPYTPPN